MVFLHNFDSKFYLKNYILPISVGIIIINLILILIAYYKNNTFFNLIGGAYDRNKKYN